LEIKEGRKYLKLENETVFKGKINKFNQVIIFVATKCGETYEYH